ncbi:MAG TPA: PQQ-binding-like beta-propeller repeat protein [Bryobacteraceae bacterium]|jgi:outer membrane protein assembly factor BamB
MKNFLAAVGFTCVVGVVVYAQARPANWPTFGGDAQRSGWERADARITKDSVKDLQLLWKMKLENQPKGPRPLLPPLILGNLISYRGFKELAFVASSSDIVYAIDADLGKTFWTKHLEYASLEPPVTGSSATCPGGLTATPTMPPPAAPGRGGAPVARGPAPAAGAAPAPPPVPARGPFAAFGAASVYTISSDGRLHKLNTSTGDDQVQPVKVLPSNASISSLNIADNVIYATTSHECNGAPNAVWAVDLVPDPPKPASFAMSGTDSIGIGGPVLGTDGTVYVQTTERLLALGPRDLKLKQSFSLTSNSASPLVITYKEQELVVTAGKDGRLNLLDSSLKPLHQTSAIGPEVWGGLSTWLEMDGTRWILAPVWGPSNSGSIAAFKVEEQGGKPVLTSAWVSRDMPSPQPPVIANGVVFALSSGKAGGHATLYALDAATGKELYSSRNLVTAPAALTGMTVANGRVYFGTTDGTAYEFGIYMEH